MRLHLSSNGATLELHHGPLDTGVIIDHTKSADSRRRPAAGRPFLGCSFTTIGTMVVDVRRDRREVADGRSPDGLLHGRRARTAERADARPVRREAVVGRLVSASMIGSSGRS